MKRILMVPAVCCAIAFAALYATLNRAETVEGESKQAPPCTLGTASVPPTLPQTTPPQTTFDAEQVLDTLRASYLQRWRTWEESRYQVLSRAAPRQQSPTSIDFLVSPKSIGPREPFLLATFVIHQRQLTHTVPCVVDPASGRVRLFHEGAWLTEGEWLNTVPATPTKKNPN